MKLVVSQPMFLPWLGLFEQISLADVFLHYPDVQLPQGRSFTTRVQIKMPNGQTQWMTAPMDRVASGKLISEAIYQSDKSWRDKHLSMLKHSYARAPHFDYMMTLAEQIYAIPDSSVSGFNIASLEMIASYIGLETEFRTASGRFNNLSGTERLVALCQDEGAAEYVTGLGALKYLDHDQFESKDIQVEYMDYLKTPYDQLHGEFTPFVSILDTIAHLGPETLSLVRSGTVNWRTLIHDTA